MRKLVFSFTLASLLLFVGTSAFAQRDYDGDERYRSFGRETLERVRADMNRAESDIRYLPGEEVREFTRVRERLADFQRDWSRGRYDRGALDGAIANLDRIVTHGRLRPRDRDFLADDLRRLREMRERYDRWRR